MSQYQAPLSDRYFVWIPARARRACANDLAVRRALETAGVEFIDENSGGPGLRLRAADGDLGGRENTGQKIRDAIEAAVIQFFEENGGGEGARLRKPRKRR